MAAKGAPPPASAPSAMAPHAASEGDMQRDAWHFFSACEAGKGWDVCFQWVAGETAEFTAQVTDSLPAPKLSEVTTIKAYTEWMVGVVKEFGEKATVDVKAAAFDSDRKVAVFYAVFAGFSDYGYALNFDNSGKITHMTKIWNDNWAAANMAQVGQTSGEQQQVTCRVKPSVVFGSAQQFFDACEAGKGWGACAEYVATDAKFNAEVTDSMKVPKLTEAKTVQEYTEWMAGIAKALGPKATIDIKAGAFDTERSIAVFYAVFGGFSDYVYSLEFDESGKITAMTKIWHDGWAAAAAAAAARAAREGKSKL